MAVEWGIGGCVISIALMGTLRDSMTNHSSFDGNSMVLKRLCESGLSYLGNYRRRFHL